MKRFTFLFIIMLFFGLMATVFCWPSDDEKITFVVQHDLKPAVNNLKFERGFNYFMKNQPSDLKVEIFGFYLNNVYPVLAEKAGKLMWPPEGFEFIATNDNTIPFKDLLAILVHFKISNQTVYFVSNCRSYAMIQSLHLEGLETKKHVNVKTAGPSAVEAYEKPFILDQRDFNPEKYEPLKTLKRYCRDKNVKIVGLFVREYVEKDLFEDDQRTGSSFFTGDMRYIHSNRADRTLVVDSIGLTAITWITEQTGGKAYYDFGSFKSLFKSFQ